MESRKWSIVGLAALLMAASAAVGGGAARAEADVRDTHCVATVPEDGGASGPLSCYEDFRALVRELTGREPRADLTSRNATDRDLNPHLYQGRPPATPTAAASDPASLAATVIGISYKDPDFGGGSWVHSVDSSGCTSTRSYSISSLSGSSWDNSISSARTYANCLGEYWEYANFGGALKLCGCSSMQAMDNKTSSMRWRVP